MTGHFSDALRQAERALDDGELNLAGNLLMTVPEAATNEGMIINPSGEVLGLKRKGQRDALQPTKVLELGMLVTVLMEDSGYKVGEEEIIRSAARYSDVLCRYADRAIPNPDERYRILKKHLMLQVQSGTYCSAISVAQTAQRAAEGSTELEAITMCFNRFIRIMRTWSRGGHRSGV
ncbi:MAG: hypothetical protein COZ06_38195 [Armatimonadetes bacterium CG_4_10_14_3_um_filter_66_18]|nr:MAG: hypothetical protein COZ06_38195 [Armatimonadetes bacterium CG_4_10_14_3_um_filter_66_18]